MAGAAAEGEFEITDQCEYDVAFLQPHLLAQLDSQCRDVPLACFSDDILRSGMLELAEWRHDASFALMAEGWAMQAVGRLNKLFRSEPRRPVPSMGTAQVGRVRDFVSAKLSDTILMDDLAREAGIPLTDFTAAFSASAKLSPAGFTRASRMSEAKRILIETRQSIEEVARATGFADARSLRRSFHACEGVTPSEFRRQRRN